MSEYPKAAYRLGSQIDIWGRMMDMRSLIDSQDETAALSDGWALHPNDVEEPVTFDKEDEPIKRRGRQPKPVIQEDDM